MKVLCFRNRGIVVLYNYAFFLVFIRNGHATMAKPQHIPAIAVGRKVAIGRVGDVVKI